MSEHLNEDDVEAIAAFVGDSFLTAFEEAIRSSAVVAAPRIADRIRESLDAFFVIDNYDEAEPPKLILHLVILPDISIEFPVADLGMIMPSTTYRHSQLSQAQADDLRENALPGLDVAAAVFEEWAERCRADKIAIAAQLEAWDKRGG